MKKFTYIILALIIIAGGYYFYDTYRKADFVKVEDLQQSPTTPNAPTPTPTKESVATPTPKTNQGGGTFSSGEENVDGGSGVQVLEVVFDGSSFSPSPLNINVNDWVFFKNASDSDLWVASDPHHSHTGYAGFDSKKIIAKGATYKFEFTKAGTFGYHNDLNPSQTGSITVK